MAGSPVFPQSPAASRAAAFDLPLPSAVLKGGAGLAMVPLGATPPAPFNAMDAAGGQVEEFTESHDFANP